MSPAFEPVEFGRQLLDVLLTPQVVDLGNEVVLDERGRERERFPRQRDAAGQRLALLAHVVELGDVAGDLGFQRIEGGTDLRLPHRVGPVLALDDARLPRRGVGGIVRLGILQFGEQPGPLQVMCVEAQLDFDLVEAGGAEVELDQRFADANPRS